MPFFILTHSYLCLYFNIVIGLLILNGMLHLSNKSENLVKFQINYSLHHILQKMSRFGASFVITDFNIEFNQQNELKPCEEQLVSEVEEKCQIEQPSNSPNPIPAPSATVTSSHSSTCYSNFIDVVQHHCYKLHKE